MNALSNSERLRYMQCLSEKFPTIAAAASEIIRIEALLQLPKETEHFISDLHGEDEAFVHILNNASGVIREKIDQLFAQDVPAQERADLATLIYYPVQKLPDLKEQQKDLHGWYKKTLYRLIDLCRLVSSKHTREFVRKRLPVSCAHILDELLHAHFEDHNKEDYYNEIIESIIRNDRADAYITRLCQLIKRLAVKHLHIVGDLFDRGPRPDHILNRLIEHQDLDFQWGNHDVVWMGAAAGSPICILTVLKTTLSYNNIDTIERGYGISLRTLEQMATRVYANSDMTRWRSKDETKGGSDWLTGAQMHKAIAIMMFKLECQVIARNPDFQMQGRDFLNHIDYKAGTVICNGKSYPLLDNDFPTVNPACPEKLTPDEEAVLKNLVHSFRESERLQRHIQFLYAKGALYKCHNGNLLFHGAVPMTKDGDFAEVTFEGRTYKGKELFDYCDRRARLGYYAPDGSPERQSGQDFLWYLWCGALSPVFGRSAMTTFERLYIADKETHKEVNDPYYVCINEKPEVVDKILAEFGLSEPSSHVINGHVPVKAIKGENPVKGGGKLIVIDGGFCRAYHSKTGIAGYTLVFNSWGLILRTHQPFESIEKAIQEDKDIDSHSEYVYRTPERLLVKDTDGGRAQAQLTEDLRQLIQAYRSGQIQESVNW